MIATNHGHVAVISGAQLLAGMGLRLDIRGLAQSHTHTVDLSAQQVAAIRDGQRVTVESSADYEDKHGHSVTFNG